MPKDLSDIFNGADSGEEDDKPEYGPEYKAALKAFFEAATKGDWDQAAAHFADAQELCESAEDPEEEKGEPHSGHGLAIMIPGKK